MKTGTKIWIIFAGIVAEILMSASCFKQNEIAFGLAFVAIILLTLFVGGAWACGEFKD